MSNIIVAGTLVPSVRPSAPEHVKINSMSGQVSLGRDTLDLSYAGSGEADMTEADRAMSAKFSNGDGQHRE